MHNYKFKFHGTVAETKTNNDTNKEGGNNIMDNVTMFNFKENWNLVEPHLYEPEVLALLDKGMSEYAGKDPDGVMPSWDRKNGIGPWEYSWIITDAWYELALDLMNESPEWERWNERYRFLSDFNNCDIGAAAREPNNPKMKKLYERFVEAQQGLCAMFLPQPGVYEWFQCIGAEHELAPWQKALAERVFPDYSWEITEINNIKFRTVIEATVIGTHPDGSRMIFDILQFDENSAENTQRDTKFTSCNSAA